MRVNEIRVNQIRVNQGLGVFFCKNFEAAGAKMQTHNFWCTHDAKYAYVLK